MFKHSFYPLFMTDFYEGFKNVGILILALLMLKHILEHSIHDYSFKIDISLTKNDLRYIILDILLAHTLSHLVYVTKSRRIAFYFLCMPFVLLNHYLISQIQDMYLKMWFFVYFLEILMKNISFAIENKSCTYLQFLYFLFTPSYIFTTNYKKKTRSIPRLIYKILYTLFFGFLFFFIQNNYTSKYLQSLVVQNTSLFSAYILFAIAVTVNWLAFFCCYFNGYLSVKLELLGHDGVLYLDWWNSKSVSEFWRKWNIPFHRFTLKYIYIKMGGGFLGRLLCFLFSAIVHEYGMYLLLGKLGGFMFIGMIGQAVILFEMGNWAFWVLFCFIGQPVVLCLYYIVYNSDDLWMILQNLGVKINILHT